MKTIEKIKVAVVEDDARIRQVLVEVFSGADDCELAPETISAIRGIRNQYGRYTQWVFVIGSGGDKIVQMAEIHLSPVMLWANTNDTNEANARRLVENLRPDLPVAQLWRARSGHDGARSQRARAV